MVAQIGFNSKFTCLVDNHSPSVLRWQVTVQAWGRLERARQELRIDLARRGFQLIVRQQARNLEVFTVGDAGEVLPVFTFEEEAELFFRLGVPEKEGWQLRETTCGEMISVLYGPCREVTRVSLDPVPDLVALVSLSRKRFISVLLSEVTPPPVEMVGVAS